MTSRTAVQDWMERLKQAWEGQDVPGALRLFENTERYYERPFYAATTAEEIHSYWQDIVNIEDIKLSYDVLAVEGDTASVHWENTFADPETKERSRLDGVFVIVFDQEGNCREFRQWWFAEG